MEDDKFKWLGHYNNRPPNYERIAETRFWEIFCGATPVLFGVPKFVCNVPQHSPLYKQRLTMFVYPDQTAIGFVNRIEDAKPAKPRIFFRTSACQHEFTETRVGKCQHRYVCNKCGYHYTLDTSD